MSPMKKEYQPKEVAILKQASASLKNGGAANKNNFSQLNNKCTWTNCLLTLTAKWELLKAPSAKYFEGKQR